MKMKDVPGFEHLYAVTEDGKVWSYRSNRFLQPYKDKGGYWVTSFTIDGVQKHFRVHRLVALAWIPNPENKPTVDHIDHDLDNNCASNLRWATYAEQEENKILTHSVQEQIQVMTEKARLVNQKAVEQRDINDHSILYATYESAAEAALAVVGDKTLKRPIQRCANKEYRSAYGYWWCYKK